MTSSAPGSELAGVGVLTHFALRRDRVRLAVWIAGITLLVVTTATSYASRYPTEADRAAIGEALQLPATVALVGPYRGGAVPTYGAMVSQAALGLACVLAALMNLLAVVRSTRADEEAGRAELVQAAPVGRRAGLTAALAVAISADVVLGGLVALALSLSGVESIDAGGSLLFGAAVGTTGLVFAGVAALTAQVSEFARGAAGLAGAVLGGAYALRAVGDVSAGWLSWLSPIGWAQATDPYGADRWWPLLLALGAAAVLMAGAGRLNRRRDLGTGLFPPRPGPPEASAALGSVEGLALRLQRAGLLAWTLGIAIVGVAYGSILGGAQDLLEQISALQHLVVAGASITESFAAALVLIVAIVVGVLAVQAVLKLRTEEAAGRVEVVLTAAVSRPRLLASHLAVAMGGGAIVLTIGGLALGVGAAISLHDASMVGRLGAAALAYVPALWVVAAFAAAVVALWPSASWLAWLGVAYPFAAYYGATYLSAPGWFEALSPYSHVPLVPAEPVSIVPLLGLAVVAAALTAVALAAFRRRDVRPGG